ncbi:MAG: GNAT family N-acetyltransferase [Firmicutes bacterium]|nr:GNAT family N-acetyltransferase [Dethiobacter sp.]MBS3888058.1 GNAT family N-acetyltransferase [Bacillota bacterium]MBS4055216.1 GNAT family N-acetyltransferase [Thermaerobacter sp.]
MQEHTREVVTLGPESRLSMATILAAAFRHDPAFVRLFKGTTPDQDAHYRRFMATWVDNSLSEGHNLLGVSIDRQLVGVVGLAGLNGSAVRWSLRQILPAMLSMVWGLNIGVGLAMLKATRRPQLVPPDSCELSMLAVSPEFQGMGVARELLVAVEEKVAKDSAASGIYLYTTALSSLRFYEHCGYKVVGHAKAAGVDVYHLFRDSGAPSISASRRSDDAP